MKVEISGFEVFFSFDRNKVKTKRNEKLSNAFIVTPVKTFSHRIDNFRLCFCQRKTCLVSNIVNQNIGPTHLMVRKSGQVKTRK